MTSDSSGSRSAGALDDATIAAPATAPGRGAIALLRLSGPRAFDIARAVLDRWPEGPRIVTRSRVRDGTAVLDDALVTRYDAPASFTGEDMVEISTHGGAVVPATVLAALLARGARLAEPGEFTRRAVLNGKMDILQAEATGDLVAATSRAAQRVALDQLDGGLSRRIMALRDDVIGIEALIAYDIDFPEEDDGPIPRGRVLDAVDRVLASLRALRDTAAAGELVREGALVVLAGPPNAGKSSLFNALLGQNRAIVTEIPGTTRDAIEAVLDTPGWPLRLVDTAGLRESDDPVERLGIEVSARYLGVAAAVLVCAESIEAMRSASAEVARRSPAPRILVHTKCDRGAPAPAALQALREETGAHALVVVSAEAGTGLADLLAAVSAAVAAASGTIELDAPILTHARHRYAVEQALVELEAFRGAWQAQQLPPPVAAVHLRQAVVVLQDLIGSVDVEDVLDALFRTFCVGK